MGIVVRRSNVRSRNSGARGRSTLAILSQTNCPLQQRIARSRWSTPPSQRGETPRDVREREQIRVNNLKLRILERAHTRDRA